MNQFIPGNPIYKLGFKRVKILKPDKEQGFHSVNLDCRLVFPYSCPH